MMKESKGLSLYDYQKQAANEAYSHGDHLLLCECGVGKGQPYGSKILTKNGYVNIEDLKLSDKICASDGNFYNVTGIYPKKEIDTYRFYYSDKTSLVFDKDHLHICRTFNDKNRNNPFRVMSTIDIIKSNIRYGKNNKSRKYDIPIVKPIMFKKNILLLNPYVMGLLLGDGCSSGGSIKFSTADKELLKYIKIILGNNYEIKYCGKYDYRITYYKHSINPIIDILKKYDLMWKRSYEKFIPKDYLFSSVKDRLELLRGLMDTDSYIHKNGTCEYCTSSEELSKDVMFLIRSLGSIPTIVKRKSSYKKDSINIQCRDSYRIHFSLNTFNPFRLRRRSKLWNSNPRGNGRWIDKIEYEKIQKTICISVVSPDNSYVTGNMVVTHNTAIELAIISHRLKLGHIRNCLVVAPLSILWSSWEEDIKKFFPHLTYRILWDKSGAKRKELVEGFEEQIGIINYEAIRLFSLPRFDMIVLDESTKIKNHASKTSKKVLSLPSKYRSILTATPGFKPEHYWAQLYFIRIIKNNFFQFRNRYCFAIPLGDTGLKMFEIKTEMIPELQELIAKKAVRLTKDKCLDLPEKVFIKREIFLPANAMSLYKKMVKDNVIEYEDEEIIAPFAGVLRQKLRQMADGILYNHESGNRHRIHKAKLDELDDIINKNTGQVIIWANYIEDVKEISNKYNAETYFSGTKDKREAHDNFKSGKSRIIVAHPASAGHGITWANCSIQVYYNLPESLELYLQSQDRTHRIGQKNTCTYYILVAKNTLDEVIWKCLGENKDFQDDLIKFARQNFKGGCSGS